jgi:predicted DNA-binding protein (MmcQ/YjbR family)
MNLESVREYCLTLPHATEMIQWVDHLLFKVGGKMFAIMALEPQDNVLSFKATPDRFFELQELDGVIPAPYMARAQWLALQRFDALRDDELKDLLATSHKLIYEKLPKRLKENLAAGKSLPKRPSGKKKRKAVSMKPKPAKESAGTQKKQKPASKRKPVARKKSTTRKPR